MKVLPNLYKKGDIVYNNDKKLGVVLETYPSEQWDILDVALPQDSEEIQEMKEEDIRQNCKIRDSDPDFIKKLKEAKIKANLLEKAKIVKAEKEYNASIGWAYDWTKQ